ncbi:hypothetical protein STEG23_013232 [Scotinomys teguina]
MRGEKEEKEEEEEDEEEEKKEEGGGRRRKKKEEKEKKEKEEEEEKKENEEEGKKEKEEEEKEEGEGGEGEAATGMSFIICLYLRPPLFSRTVLDDCPMGFSFSCSSLFVCGGEQGTGTLQVEESVGHCPPFRKSLLSLDHSAP